MLKDYFKSDWKKLSRNEQRIIMQLDEELKHIDNFTISHIANRTFSSTSSINRLVKKLNLTYSEFKFILISLHKNSPLTKNSNISSDFFIPPKLIEDILNSQQIFLIGVGQNKYFTNYLSEILFELNINNSSFNDSHLISNLDTHLSNDILIIFISHSGNTKTLLEIASKVNKTNTSILITTNKFSKLEDFSTYTIINTPTIELANHYSFALGSPLITVIDSIIADIIKMINNSL